MSVFGRCIKNSAYITPFLYFIAGIDMNSIACVIFFCSFSLTICISLFAGIGMDSIACVIGCGHLEMGQTIIQDPILRNDQQVIMVVRDLPTGCGTKTERLVRR